MLLIFCSAPQFCRKSIAIRRNPREIRHIPPQRPSGTANCRNTPLPSHVLPCAARCAGTATPTEEETPCGGHLCDFPRRCYSRHFRDSRSSAPHHHRDKDSASCFATDKFIFLGSRCLLDSRVAFRWLPTLARSSRPNRFMTLIMSVQHRDLDESSRALISLSLYTITTTWCMATTLVAMQCMHANDTDTSHPRAAFGQGPHCQAAGSDRVSTHRIDQCIPHHVASQFAIFGTVEGRQHIPHIARARAYPESDCRVMRSR